MASELIRDLDPVADLEAVAAFQAEAPDGWVAAEGAPPGPDAAARFFADAPPDCDPGSSRRLGLFLDGRLSGLAELAFGFPAPGDAYLGLMVLGPWARGKGRGAAFLARVEGLARGAGAGSLFLGVLEANARRRAFWERRGFRPTGVSRVHEAGGRRQVVLRLFKPL